MKWLMLALVCAASLARAEEEPAYEKVRDRAGRLTIRIKKAFIIEGRKPEAFILLPRSLVGYDDPALEQPLSSRIIEATRHEPF